MADRRQELRAQIDKLVEEDTKLEAAEAVARNRPFVGRALSLEVTTIEGYVRRKVGLVTSLDTATGELFVLILSRFQSHHGAKPLWTVSFDKQYRLNQSTEITVAEFQQEWGLFLEQMNAEGVKLP
jgi:hypothetical protein